MSADWFCKIGEKQVGPLSGQQLKTVVAKGQLRPEHLLRRGTEGPWIPAGRVKGLFPETPPAGAQPKTPAKGTPQVAAGGKPAKPDAGKPGALPSAQEAAQPPSDMPDEFKLGSAGHKKHHVAMNVANLDIQAQPVKVSHRKSRPLGLKKDEAKKLNTILLCVIGVGTTIALIVFIWAFSQGMFSSKTEAKKDEAKTEEPDLEKKEAKARPKTEDDEWTEIPKVVASGSIEVKIAKPTRGAPPEGAKVDAAEHEEVLVLPTTLKVKLGTTKEVEYQGWTESTRKDISLKDDSKKKVPLLDIVEAKSDVKAIGPGKPVQLQLIFAAPPKKVKYLRLELPASAIKGEGMLKFQIPSKSITAGEAAPAKKADDDSSETKTKAKKAKKSADSGDEDAADADAKPTKKAAKKAADDDAADADAKPAKKSAKKVADEDEPADIKPAPSKKKAKKKADDEDPSEK